MVNFSLSQLAALYSVLFLFSACAQASICRSPIYCTGELLYTIQMANIYYQSKNFVDLKLLKSEETILNHFEILMTETGNNPSSFQLKDFLHRYFEDRDELYHWHPADSPPFPNFISQIKNQELQDFATHIISSWPKLGRKVSLDVAENPQQYSFIYVPKGFIVPEEKYKELYYWDSYWIIRGLLISNMTKTARGMIEIFLYLVLKFGYVPNGSRIYYLGRSQPPLLTWMVYDYFELTGDISWLAGNIATVETELQYWLKKKISIILNEDKYTLLRYVSDVKEKGPRPESYNIDYKNAQKIPDDMREIFYKQIKSAAESAWDFSSRWLASPGTEEFNLTAVSTTHILPVDLNSIFASALQKIGHLRNHLGHQKSASKWWDLAKKWRDAIEKVLWDVNDGVWYDYDSLAKSRRNYFYVSCAAPLWAGAVEPWLIPERGKHFVRYLQSTGALKYPGGIPTSLWHTGEQFDYPHVWPPLQAVLIGALENSGCSEAKRLAAEQIQIFIRSTYLGFKKYNAVFDNYDCLYSGEPGSRWELFSRDSFGWTNSYILELLQRYGNELNFE